MDEYTKLAEKYTLKNIETAEVIEELINIAKKMQEDDKRMEKLKMSEEEIAFYDALADNKSAKEILGDETLKKIAKEIATNIKNNLTIDWTLRENVQANIRVIVKRLLRKYNYPPDKQKKATELVLEQAKVTCKDWAEK